MAMFPHILAHPAAALYPSFLRSCSSSVLSASHTPTTSTSSLSLSPEFIPSTTNTSFLVENILRDRAAAAAAVVAASKDCNSINSINSPFITRPYPMHPNDHSPCGYSNCSMKQCISGAGGNGDLIKRERSAELLTSSDHETESSYGDLQSESNTPPIKSNTAVNNIPLKFGVSAILSDTKDNIYSTVKHHHFLSHHKVPSSVNETIGAYNYSGITKPIARPFLESHFQSLVACRTSYLTGSNHTHPASLAGSVNCSNGLTNGLSAQTHHHHHHPLGLHFATSFPWAAAARGKPRRGMMRRAVFSDAQRQGLEKRFQIQKYISKPDRKKLAEKLGLKDSQAQEVLREQLLHNGPVHTDISLQVKIWFQNRRMKWRNSKERELLSSGGSRDQTLPTKNNPNPDLSDPVTTSSSTVPRSYSNGVAVNNITNTSDSSLPALAKDRNRDHQPLQHHQMSHNFTSVMNQSSGMASNYESGDGYKIDASRLHLIDNHDMQSDDSPDEDEDDSDVEIKVHDE